MLTQLLLYLGMLLLGVLIGYFEMGHKKLEQVLGKLQIGSLLLILFVMGIRLGGDKKVVNSLGDIGLQAFLLALGSILFSIFFVFLGRYMVSRIGTITNRKINTSDALNQSPLVVEGGDKK